MKVKTRVLLAGALVATSCVACASSANSAPPPVSDPRVGWVTVATPDSRPGDHGSTYVQKTCDGTTLVYYAFSWRGGSGGISTIQNSPECAAR